MITIDLSKEQVLDAIQKNNSTGNLVVEAGAKIFIIIEEAKETVIDFLQGTVKVF